MMSLQGVRQTHELSYTSGSGCLVVSSDSGTSSERTKDSINARYAIDKSSGLKPRCCPSPLWTALSGVGIGCFSLLNRTNLPDCHWMNSAYQSRSAVRLYDSGLGLGIVRNWAVGFRFGWESNRFIGAHNGLRENKKLVHLTLHEMSDATSLSRSVECNPGIVQVRVGRFRV